MVYRLVNKTFLRQIKVLLKLFQKLVDSKEPLVGFKGEALNISCPQRADKVRPYWLMLLMKENESVDKVHRFRSKECWASPKGVSLSAESDKGVALDLWAFEKAQAKLLSVLEKFAN